MQPHTPKRSRCMAAVISCPEPRTLLTAAEVVCRDRYVFAGLPHVTQCISSFADSFGSCWNLETLSRKGPKKIGEATSARLLDRLLAQEFSGLDEPFRRRRCEVAVDHAIADGHMLILDWWLTKYLPLTHEIALANMITAIENKRIRVLDWLELQGVLPSTANHMNCSQPESAYWLHERGYRLTIGIAIAIADDDLKFLKWCHTHEHLHFMHDLEEAIVAAARANSVRIAQWLVDTYPSTDWNEPDGNCNFRCSVEMLKWLEDNLEWEDDGFGCAHEKWINGSMELAASVGRLDVVEYLCMHPLHELSFQYIYDAAFGGHMALVQWLHTILPICTESAMDYAARGGHFEIVRWLHGHMNRGCQMPRDYAQKHGRLIDVAALHGCLEMVQWFHEFYPSECSTDAMDNAAWIGNLDILQWLHSNRNEGCTKNALQRAVTKGHLEVVQWLLGHRPECFNSISPSIMDLAAEYGHLDIVKWLHENRSEGCTKDAIDKAAREGYLNVVEFLVMNRAEGCTINGVEDAAANGHVDIVKLLFDSQLVTEDATDVVFFAAAHGHFDIIRWFYHTFRSLITEEAFDEAAQSGHVQIVQFLHDRCNLLCTDEAVDMAGKLKYFAVQEWFIRISAANPATKQHSGLMLIR